jgi:predicted phosphodiesterase
MKKALLLSFSFVLVFNSYAFRFLANSDAHVGEKITEQYMFKSSQCVAMQRLIQARSDIQAVLWTGDLTEDGTDDQFNGFKREFVDPFEVKFIPVYLAYGNHDMTGQRCGCCGSGKTAAMKYVSKTHGGTHYAFEQGGVHFLCCGKYPGEGDVNTCWWPFHHSWLARQLRAIGTNAPVVIFFHYNLVGAFSSWWARGSRDTFFRTIEDYNVKMIITGHKHETFSCMWRGKIPAICVGGRYFAELEYTDADQDLNVTFYDAAGTMRTWDQLFNTTYIEEQ